MLPSANLALPSFETSDTSAFIPSSLFSCFLTRGSALQIPESNTNSFSSSWIFFWLIERVISQELLLESTELALMAFRFHASFRNTILGLLISYIKYSFFYLCKLLLKYTVVSILNSILHSFFYYRLFYHLYDSTKVYIAFKKIFILILLVHLKIKLFSIGAHLV